MANQEVPLSNEMKKSHSCLVLLMIFLVAGFTLYTIGFFPRQEGISTFYVKSSTANIRECPDKNCKVIDTFPQGSTIHTNYKTLNETPDWVEIDYSNAGNQNIVGYISKTVLSDQEITN